MEKQTSDTPKMKKPNPFAGSGWIHHSIGFGFIIFVAMFIVYPLIAGQAISLKSIIFGLVSSTVGGLAYGLTMKFLYSKKLIKD